MARLGRAQPFKPKIGKPIVSAAPPPTGKTSIFTSALLASKIIAATFPQGQQIPTTGGIIK